MRLIEAARKNSREIRYELPGRKRVVIGSAPGNDVILDAGTVSRRHALIVRGLLGRYPVFDLASSNGTFINGQRVKKASFIKSGDEISFGAERLFFYSASEPIKSKIKKAVPILGALFALSFAATQYMLNNPVSHFTTEKSHANVNINNADSAALRRPVAVSSMAPPAVAASALINSRAWLIRLNEYRKAAGLPTLIEDPKWSTAAASHARYLVKTYGERFAFAQNPLTSGISHGITLTEAHSESPNDPWYTADGARAAQSGDELILPFPLKPATAIDDWMTVPFHRVDLLVPTLINVGFGMYCLQGICAASITMTETENGRPNTTVEFPPDGSSMSLTSMEQPETPDPLSQCKNYRLPTGLPITLQLGSSRLGVREDGHIEALATAKAWTPKLGEYSVTHNGSSVEVCGFGNGDTVPLVILLPRHPLAGGAEYEVHIVANGAPYDWHFSIQ